MLIRIKYFFIICAFEITRSDLKRKILTWSGIRFPDLQIYQLMYLGSIDPGLNFIREKQYHYKGAVGYDTICHILNNFALFQSC